MWVNLSKIIHRLDTAPDVRAIFLTAAGDRAFSAGLDVQVCIPSARLPPHLRL